MRYSFFQKLTLTKVLLATFVFISLCIAPSWSQMAGPHGEGIAFPRALPAQVASTGATMMASAVLANGLQQIAVVDPSKATMAVYHIDPNTGEIQLKSVRKMDADFMLQEFNLNEPTPSTIRKNVR